MKIFKELSKQQLIGIAVLAFSNFCSTVVASCLVPFYQEEALRRGISQSKIGLLFGLFQLVMFTAAPLLGKHVHLIGSKWMCIAGLLIAGMATIAFGFLNWVSEAVLFFWASLLVRLICAFGEACFLTASFALCTKCFPDQISTIVGILETFGGFGFTVGPLIGSVLYEKFGGFHMPFFVLSFFLFAGALLSYFLIEEVKDGPFEDHMGMLIMLKIPTLWLMLFAVVLCAISLSFLDPVLSDHLRNTFELTKIQTGLIYLLCDGCYGLTAMVWGFLLGRWHFTSFLMFFGSSATIASLVLIGVLGNQLILVGTSLVILGIASSALFIPSFQQCFDVVKKKGYNNSIYTYGCISGLVHSSYALGGFIGPTLFGGWCFETFGMLPTTLAVAVLNLFFILALFVFLIVKHFFAAATYFVDGAPQQKA